MDGAMSSGKQKALDRKVRKDSREDRQKSRQSSNDNGRSAWRTTLDYLSFQIRFGRSRTHVIFPNCYQPEGCSTCARRERGGARTRPHVAWGPFVSTLHIGRFADRSVRATLLC